MPQEGRAQRLQEQVERLERRLSRERERRRQAERIAETATRDLTDGQQLLEQAAVTVHDKADRLEKRIRQQTVLQEVSEHALRNRDLEDLLHGMCRRTNEVLDTDLCDVFELRLEREDLVLRAAAGWPANAVGRVTLDASGGSQSGHTVRHWQPTVVEDYREEDRFQRPFALTDQGVLSGVTVVVPAPDDPWGVFGVHARQPRAFDEHDVTFVQTMARVLSHVIQRQRARERLRYENQRFASLIREVEEYAIFRLDAAGRIRSWNAGAENVYGYPAERILGEPLSTLYPRKDRREGRPTANLEAAAANDGTRDEGWRVRGDGRRFWANVTITPYRDEKGAIEGYWKVVQDLTERRERKRWLETSNERLRQVTHAASHDLREPARTVVTYLQLLRETCGDRFDEAEWELFDFAREGANRMERTARNLRELADVMATHRPVEAIDANDALAQALARLEDEIEATDARIASGELPTVEADPYQLSQLFQQLVANGLAYSGDTPPTIEIGAERSDRGWHFTVEDDGIGIDTAYADRVFEPFRHLGRGRSGEGIGLTICKQIVDRHGGEIWIDSEPGQGSTVHFVLAEAPAEPPPAGGSD